MKIIVTAAMLALASASAFAQQVIAFDDPAHVAAKSRAQVKGEVLAARADGTLDRYGEVTRIDAPTRARAQAHTHGTSSTSTRGQGDYIRG